jgi:ABC-type transport system substrate-binding protein
LCKESIQVGYGGDAVSRKINGLISVSILILSSLALLDWGRGSPSSSIHNSGLPKIDEVLFKAYIGVVPEAVVDEFFAGEIDWIEGPGRSDLYDRMVAAGHTISEMDPRAEFTFAPINCRDYKLSSGETNFPLNESTFRLAMSYIYGMDDKQADIYGYYGVPWYYALGNPVPDAQLPYYMGNLLPDTDYDTAWSILQADGWYIDEDTWLAKNGIKARPPDGPAGGKITFLYSAGLVWPWGPGGGWVRNFNEFITYINATGPTMQILPTDFTTLVLELLVVRDYDIIGIGLTNLGRYVDWIYDLFHSSQDVPWGWNFAGICDADFDRWGDIILTSLNMTEIVEAAQLWQQKFCHELFPWMPVIAGKEFCTTANDTRGELSNIIPMDNFGPLNPWSFMALHWKGEPGIAWPGGTITFGLEDAPDTLNPWTENTYCGWQIMDRVISGLLMVEPVNLYNMPWIASDWEIEYWTSIPELGIVNGCMNTFYLRQDVTWHDGKPVTAYDCVENIRFIEFHNPVRCGRCGGARRYTAYEEADGPYKFTTYHYQPSLYMTDYVSEVALFTPKHVLEIIEDYGDDYYYEWTPSDNAYEDLGLGPPPEEYPFMKQLVGCGPFVFDYYNRDTDMGRVERFQDFFVNAPVIGSVIGEWRIDPNESYAYKPLIQNIAAMESNENGALTNVTVDIKIFEDGLLAHEVFGLPLDPWNWTYLGPYTMEDVSCGLHNVAIEIFEHAFLSLIHNYTHTFVSTVREDLTTYSGELLDFQVDMRDIGRAARAFGSYPGHLRWDPACDVNDDFQVDMRDIGQIARKFGWTC